MIYIILILSALLRIIKLDQSLWWDEAINLVNAKNFSFWDFVTRYPIGDFHPPGYFALLWGWTHLLGFSEIVVRVPSVVFGVGGVLIVYLLGKELFNKKVATLASLLMAMAPLHVYFSQEARMYSLAAFSVILSFYFFWKVINHKNKIFWLGYVISNVLVFYSDYLPYFIFPTQLLFLIWCQRTALKKILLLQAFSFMFLIPWLAIFPLQFLTGTKAAESLTGWAQVVGGANLKQLLLIPIKTIMGRMSFDDKFIYAGIVFVIAAVYGLVIWNALKKLDKATKLLILWIVLPVVLAFLISLFVPVLAYFRMIFILPALYLLLSKGIEVLPKKMSVVILIFVCLVSLISLTAYYTNPKFQRENWKEAVKAVEKKAQRKGVILFENNNLPAPFIYYSQNLVPAYAGLGNLNLREEDIYLFEYLVDINDPNRLLEQLIKKKGFTEIEILNFEGVGFVRHFKLQ